MPAIRLSAPATDPDRNRYSVAAHRTAMDQLRSAGRGPVVDAAEAELRSIIPAEIQDNIREAHAQDPLTWWAEFDWGWGMAAIARRLRAAGYDETRLGVDDLTRIIRPLVEQAVIGPLVHAAGQLGLEP